MSCIATNSIHCKRGTQYAAQLPARYSWRNSTCHKTAQGKEISSRNAFKPTSVKHALEVIAADVWAAVRRAKKATRA